MAIIGAGASGLAIAHALRRAGARHVTVFEKADRVGGKCSTFTYEGRAYELGAGAVTSAYDSVRALMRETGVRSSAGIGGLLIDLERKRSTFVPEVLRSSALLGLGVEGPRLLAALVRERRALAPGFVGVSPELHLPFAEWAKRRGLERVASMLEPWCTGFGYGYFDEVPAAYILKYVALFRFPVGELLDTGYQGLWERVASTLDVRLGTEIRSIVRGDDVVISTARGEQRFDALFVACPFDDATRFLDASAGERDLFGRIVHQPYDVVAAAVDGGPRARYGFIPRHLRRDREGHVVFWYRRFLDRDLVLYYCQPPAGASLDATCERVRADVEQMGDRVRRIHLAHRWRYFPHVRTRDMDAGFYDRLEGLQGARRTYWAGELLAFSTVETVTAYANDLVLRRLAGRPA